MKAVKSDGAQEILEAAGYGYNTLSKMETLLKCYGDVRPGTAKYREVKIVEKAIPFMRQMIER